MAGILSIPIEIQQKIAINMDTKTLLAFRLTNHELSHAIHDLFLYRYFSTLRFLSTTTSLSIFSQICRSPRLRPKLQAITFCFLQLEGSLSDEVREEFLHGAAAAWLADGLFFLKQAGILPIISAMTYTTEMTEPFRPDINTIGAVDLMSKLQRRYWAPGWSKRGWVLRRNPGVWVLVEAMKNDFPFGDLDLEEDEAW